MVAVSGRSGIHNGISIFQRVASYNLQEEVTVEDGDGCISF